MTSEVNADAVVLVGGKGTRLRPLTLSAPKPMLPTAGTPFLSHLFSRIREAGMTHVVLGTSYRAEVFEEYFGDGSAHGLELESIAELDLDAPGQVEHWPEERRATTLGVLLIRMVSETAHHSGHADIVREMIDGRGGSDHDMADEATWEQYLAKVQAAADTFR